MPKGDFTKTKEFIIPLRGVVRDGQLAALLDQSDQEIGMPVTAVESVTGGVGIIGPDGDQIAGNAAPYAFTTRALTAADNGMTLVCATAQTATVNAGLPPGFGVAAKNAITFSGGDGVTITDVRSTGATAPWCALVQTAANIYDVVGTKA